MSKITDFLLGLETTDEQASRTVTVGTTSQKVFEAHPDRVWLYVMNPTGNTIYMRPDPEVVFDQGFIVPSNGGTFSLNVKEDGDIVHEDWYAISNIAGNTIFRYAEVTTEQAPFEE